jgi:hypothetical protein
VSATRLDTWPYFTITKSGVQYAIPAQATPQRDETYRPVPVARNPKIAFPPPLATANPDGSAARRNYDIDEVIFTTWQQGMGFDTYPATSPPAGFQAGRLETRFPGTLVCRPLATTLGSLGVALGAGVRVVELGYASARLLVYAIGTTGYRLNGAAWAAIQNGGVNLIVYQHALGLNGVFVVASKGGTYGVFRSTDGVTWDAMAVGGLTHAILGVAEFDNRLFALDTFGTAAPLRNLNTIYASTDVYTAAAGAGTWTAGNTFTTPPNEYPLKLFTWLYPPDKGRTTLWCLTGARLWYYDYYAATPTWVLWLTFRSPLNMPHATAGNDVVVSTQNNNLYVCIGDKRYVWEFTGAAVTRFSPEARGGLPAGFHLDVEVLAEDGQQVFGFAARSDDTTSYGAATAMLEGGSWHHLWDNTDVAFTQVVGGGVGATKLWAALANGSTGFTEVWELDNWDLKVLPQNASGRTYEANIQYLTTGWIAGGLTNVNKRWLYVEVDAIKANGAPGLDAGAQVSIGYEGRRSGVGAATTLTAASTWPAVIDYQGAVADKEFRLIIGLKRGTATSATPIVRAIKLGYRPRPKQRYTYTLRADVRDDCPAFDTANGLFRGHSASYLRQFLDELSDNDDAGQDDPLVGLSYGGKGNSLHPRYRSAPQCEVLVQGQESVEDADGLYLLTFNDVSAPTSG